MKRASLGPCNGASKGLQSVSRPSCTGIAPPAGGVEGDCCSCSSKSRSPIHTLSSMAKGSPSKYSRRPLRTGGWRNQVSVALCCFLVWHESPRSFSRRGYYSRPSRWCTPLQSISELRNACWNARATGRAMCKLEPWPPALLAANASEGKRERCAAGSGRSGARRAPRPAKHGIHTSALSAEQSPQRVGGERGFESQRLTLRMRVLKSIESSRSGS